MDSQVSTVLSTPWYQGRDGLSVRSAPLCPTPLFSMIMSGESPSLTSSAISSPWWRIGLNWASQGQLKSWVGRTGVLTSLLSQLYPELLMLPWGEGSALHWNHWHTHTHTWAMGHCFLLWGGDGIQAFAQHCWESCMRTQFGNSFVCAGRRWADWLKIFSSLGQLISRSSYHEDLHLWNFCAFYYISLDLGYWVILG